MLLQADRSTSNALTAFMHSAFVADRNHGPNQEMTIQNFYRHFLNSYSSTTLDEDYALLMSLDAVMPPKDSQC